MWFRVGLRLDPASVSVLQAVSPILTAAMIMAAQRVSIRLGECAWSGPASLLVLPEQRMT